MATASYVRSPGFSRIQIEREKPPQGRTSNFWACFFVAWLILAIFSAASLSLAAEQSKTDPERSNPPSDKQRMEKAKQTIVQMFQKDFDQATSPAKKKKLSQQLLDNVPRIKDDAEVRYALLTEAKALAITAGQTALTLEVIDLTVKYFRIEPIEAKTAALEELSKSVRDSAAHREIAAAALELSKQASADSHFDDAQRLAMLALVAARRSHSMQFIRQANESLLEINAAKKKMKP